MKTLEYAILTEKSKNIKCTEDRMEQIIVG